MSRLLVLRLSALGDVIHTIPAATTLRAGRVSWVVETAYRELVEIVAGVEAIPVRMKKWGRAPLASRREMAETRRAMRGADVSVDFQGLMKSAFLGAVSGAPLRYGFDRAAIREKGALLFTNRRVAVDTTRHVVEQNLQLAAAVGATGDAPRANWDAFPHDPQRTLSGYAGAVVLLPGAGKREKLWPVERYRELARLIGPRAVVAWGPGERTMAEAIGGRIAPETNLRELAFLLRGAEVVIGGDTGPLHLAAALGTKVIGLYGPTNPQRTGPYGQLDRCIDESASTKCMEGITVEQVMKMLRKVAAE